MEWMAARLKGSRGNVEHVETNRHEEAEMQKVRRGLPEDRRGLRLPLSLLPSLLQCLLPLLSSCLQPSLSPRLLSFLFLSSLLSSPPSFPPSVLAVQNKDGAAKLPALLTDLCGSP